MLTTPNTPQVIGAALMVARKRCGLSRVQVAERLPGFTVMRRNDLTRWETGSAQPDLMGLCELAVIYGVTPGDLLDLIFILNRDIPHDRPNVIKFVEQLAAWRAADHL